MLNGTLPVVDCQPGKYEADTKICMVNLNELLTDIPIIQQTGETDIEINSIQFDSRNVSPGDLFVAIKGENFDGHDFIDAAIRHRARAVVTEIPPPDDRVPCIQVGNTRNALAHLSSAFYGHSWRSMTMIGITGTNGKTSTAYLIDSILRADGLRTGMLGTVEYRIGSESVKAEWTTPESSTLHKLLHSMVEHRTDAVVLEVSSHALEQYRVEGLVFRIAVFTNISQDHLDYHRSMEEYAAAKQRLFRMVDPVKGENIINGDDPMSEVMVRQNRRPVFSFSAEPGKADVFPGSAQFSFDGISAVLKTPRGDLNIKSSLVGRHNLQNIMAAVSVSICLDIPDSSIEKGIENISVVPGRLEQIKACQPFHVLVDFAHTPYAIQKALKGIREIFDGKLTVIFGCGGDRDRTKRPFMGAVAEDEADKAVLTSDNPRTEDPEQIIRDTLEGVKNKDKMEVILNRKEAIHKTLDNAEKNECVVILGKGHEPYQIIGKEKILFDDRETARAFLTKKFGNTGNSAVAHNNNRQSDSNDPIDVK